MSIFTLFIILNIANVILQTVKSITTIKCGKTVAAAVNAIAYGLYTYVIVYTTIDGITLFNKALVVAIANFIGVYTVKYIEERMRKDKLWKVEATIRNEYRDRLTDALAAVKVPFSGLTCSDNTHSIVNVYCSTAAQSITVKGILNEFKAKYFVSETKSL